MPPPVWYCNFAYDVSGNTAPGQTHMVGSQLGSHQAGDCIRWRPPAYRNFIHYVDAGSHGGNGSSYGSRAVSAVGSSTNVAGMHIGNSGGSGSSGYGGSSGGNGYANGHVQFQVPSVAAVASGEKEHKSKGKIC